jgi:hypothetical protein
MSDEQQPDDEEFDAPATRGDLMLAVIVVLIGMMLCSMSDSCGRRFQYNNLREHLDRIERRR